MSLIEKMDQKIQAQQQLEMNELEKMDFLLSETLKMLHVSPSITDIDYKRIKKSIIKIQKILKTKIKFETKKSIKLSKITEQIPLDSEKSILAEELKTKRNKILDKSDYALTWLECKHLRMPFIADKNPFEENNLNK